jgi:hypothetical protein
MLSQRSKNQLAPSSGLDPGSEEAAARGVEHEFARPVNALLARFEEIGIAHVDDASIFGRQNPPTMKRIDFALKCIPPNVACPAFDPKPDGASGSSRIHAAGR